MGKQLEAVIEQKDLAIEERDNLIVYLRSEIENLNRQLVEKNKLEHLCDKLKRKCGVLDEMVGYKEALEIVCYCLGNGDGDTGSAAQNIDDVESSLIEDESTSLTSQSNPSPLLDVNANVIVDSETSEEISIL